MMAMHEVSAAELVQIEGGSLSWGVTNSRLTESISLNFTKVGY
jgi:hypothetical protein